MPELVPRAVVVATLKDRLAEASELLPRLNVRRTEDPDGFADLVEDCLKWVHHVHATLEHYYRDWNQRFAWAGGEQHPQSLTPLNRTSLRAWLQAKMHVLAEFIADDDTGDDE